MNSQNAKGERPKDWKQYLFHLASKINDLTQRAEVEDCINEGELLTACELARDYLKQDVFKTVLLSEFSDKAFKPSRIHDDLTEVDSRFVLTTNFDKLYENRANEIQHNTVLVKNYYDDDVADVFRRSQRVVLKIHGTIDSPDKTIFTRSQYAQARKRYTYFYQLLRSLFITHTFVFLGASLRDPDIQMLLEDHAYRFAGARPHFIVMPKHSARPGVISVMEKSMNLRSLLYDPTNSHQELADSVKELVVLVNDARDELTRTLDW